MAQASHSTISDLVIFESPSQAADLMGSCICYTLLECQESLLPHTNKQNLLDALRYAD